MWTDDLSFSEMQEPALHEGVIIFCSQFAKNVIYGLVGVCVCWFEVQDASFERDVPREAHFPEEESDVIARWSPIQSVGPTRVF
jgi:hypothetical protein